MMVEEHNTEESTSRTEAATQRQQHRDQIPEVQIHASSPCSQSMLKVPSPCPQSMLTVHACSPYFELKLQANHGEAAYNTLEVIDEPTNEQLVNEPDDGMANEVRTEEAAHTQPCDDLHQMKGETIEPPMPATASNKKVTYILPIRTMKSAEIEEAEYDEFYKSTVNNNGLGLDKGSADSDVQLLGISKEILK
jgi:hypothetical protein